MKIEIKSWLDGKVLFEGEFGSVKLALEMGVSKGVCFNYARLDGARLDGARLDGASLVRASLDGARLDPIRNDIWAVLSLAPREAEGLLKAIKEGRINGSAYQGECACLVGTIANVRKCNYRELGVLKPDSSRPAECFFLAISKGDTPATSQFSALAAKWVEEWLTSVRGAFAGAA